MLDCNVYMLTYSAITSPIYRQGPTNPFLVTLPRFKRIMETREHKTLDSRVFISKSACMHAVNLEYHERIFVTNDFLHKENSSKFFCLLLLIVSS
jgi:hypothetical protein